MASPSPEINRKTFLIVGLLLLILSVIGLLMCFATPLFSSEFEGDTESWYYGDLGEDFEESFGSEYDEYYSGSANIILLGYILILLISILLIIEGIKGSISNFISRNILRISPTIDSNASRAACMVILSLLMIIPTAIVIIGGTRFIGLSTMAQGYMDSFRRGGETLDYTFGTPAGYATAIIGFFILFLCIFFIIRMLPQIQLSSESSISRLEYSRKIGRYSLIILIISLIGLVTIPLFSFMNEEYDRSWDLNLNIQEADEYMPDIFMNMKYTDHYNDGAIHIEARSGGGDEIDDIMEDMDGSISLIALSLVFIFTVSIITLFGVIFYRVGMFLKGSHLLMTFGCLFLIFVIIIFVGYWSLGSAIDNMDEVYKDQTDEELMDLLDYGIPPDLTPDVIPINIEHNAVMGSNYMPLIAGLIILIISLLYTVAIWPISVLIVLGKRAPEAPPEVPTAPLPGAPAPITTAAPPATGAPAPATTAATPPAAVGAPAKGPIRPEPAVARVPGKPIPRNIIAVIIIVIIVIIAGAAGAYFLMSGGDANKKDKGAGGGMPNYTDLPTDMVTFGVSDYSSENSETEYQITDALSDANRTVYVYQIDATLEWYDEPDQTFRHENEPDVFALRLISPTGEIYESDMVANDQSSKQGNIDLTTGEIDPPVGWEEDLGADAFWTAVIVCGECGDHRAQPAVLMWNDTGNSWDLSVDFNYYYYSPDGAE